MLHPTVLVAATDADPPLAGASIHFDVDRLKPTLRDPPIDRCPAIARGATLHALTAVGRPGLESKPLCHY